MKLLLLQEVKLHFLKSFKEGDPVYHFLPRHVEEAEKWAKRILKDYPEADKEVVLLSVWLHDIGQVMGEKNIDHAVKSEAEARRFLSKVGLATEKIERVAHCVRAHRARDVQPETLEAKILAAADSVSHMTDINYIVMASEEPKGAVLAKLERDFRDASFFPKLQEEITPLYKAWKNLLNALPR